MLYDKLHSYEVAFVAAGVPPILGAIVMCFIPRVKQVRVFSAAKEESDFIYLVPTCTVYIYLIIKKEYMLQMRFIKFLFFS